MKWRILDPLKEQALLPAERPNIIIKGVRYKLVIFLHFPKVINLPATPTVEVVL